MLGQRCRRIGSQATNQLASALTRSTQVATHRVPAVTRFNASRLTAFRQFSSINARLYSTSPDSSAAAAPSAPATPNVPEKPDYLDDAESAIWDQLTAEFAPTQLQVQDVSGGCGSMYGIEITSEKFRGVNMLKQQRMVNACLGEKVKEWHGLQLRTKVPA
ncbi:BolA-like protein 3 [Apiospora marii]|uniref:BolA-like protein 3 n=1 Tax=Apiospora marii TaxID=335849 RepID=A0ABR1S3L1_9PEZI